MGGEYSTVVRSGGVNEGGEQLNKALTADVYGVPELVAPTRSVLQ